MMSRNFLFLKKELNRMLKTCETKGVPHWHKKYCAAICIRELIFHDFQNLITLFFENENILSQNAEMHIWIANY